MGKPLDQLLTAAVECSRDGVTITSADLDAPGPTILYVNPAFTRITGYSAEEVVGKSPRILQGPKTDRRVLGKLRTALSTQEPFFGETINYRKDGSEFSMEWRISPIRSDEEITHWVAIQRDVSKQRRVEQECRESQENWQAIVETAPGFVLILDRDGAIRFINRTHTDLTKEKVVGVSAYAFIEPSHHDTVRRAIESVYQTESFAECEFRGRGDSDGDAWYECRMGPCWNEGRLEGVVCIATDITARKTMESTVREQHAEFARVLRVGSMGEMASSLAHQLNQPLTAIANYARGAVRAKKQRAFSSADLAETMQFIGDQAIGAGKIVSRWKQFISRATPRRSTVDINDLITEIMEFIKPYSDSQQVSISFRFAKDLPNVNVDRIQIQQVIVNLLHNAFHAMRHVPPTRRQVVVQTSLDDDYLLVSVIDSGEGIREDMLQRCFEPFFTTKEDGLGMGLSVSKNIVELHEGELHASTNAEIGMTFRFSLPVTV